MTINDLARVYEMEPHAVRAALDLGDALDDETPIDEFEDWTQERALEALDILVETAAAE